EAMLSRVLVPQRNVQRIHAEIKDPHATASEYERQLREFFQLGVSEVPRFDLILLGLGADGHTASIFPDTALVHEKTKLVAAAWVEKLQTYRITLTMPALNHACEVLFLVSGEAKAPVLRDVLEGDRDVERLPAQAVECSTASCCGYSTRAQRAGHH